MELPQGLNIKFIEGEAFIKIREAAKLSSIHPVALEMAQKLLNAPDKGAARLALKTPEMKKNADAIKKELAKSLNKVAKFMADEPLRTVSARDGDTLIFWYQRVTARPGRKTGQSR